MTEYTPAAPDGSGGTGYPPPPDCKPDLLDKLKCKAAGVKAQADYNTKYDGELTKARGDYETARIQYRTARDAAKKTYEDLGTQLDKVLEQLRCLIDDKKKVGLLDEAFANVEQQLARCPGQSGCAFTDTCDFDDLVRCPPQDIAGAIKKIEARIDAAKAVFDDLVKEPTALPARVTAVKGEVDAIVTAMATDSRSVDFGSLYVKALVAQSHRNNLWRGFDDGNAYVDCICRALLCQLRGREAAARLTRREAVKKCKDDAWDAHCADLRDHTDVAVLEEYERLRARQQKGYGEQQGGDYGEQGAGDHPTAPPKGGGDYPSTTPPKGGGSYPTTPGGSDYPTSSGGGDYPTQPGGGDYPTQPGGGDYPTPSGGGYEEEQDDDYDDLDEDDDYQPGGDYGPPQGGKPGGGDGGRPGGGSPPQQGGYGKGQQPDQGRGSGSERRPGRPGPREPRG